MIRYRFRNSITIRPIVLLAVIRTSSIIIIEPTLWSNRHQNVTVIDLYHILSIYSVYYTVHCTVYSVLHTHTPREREREREIFQLQINWILNGIQSHMKQLHMIIIHIFIIWPLPLPFLLVCWLRNQLGEWRAHTHKTQTW